MKKQFLTPILFTAGLITLTACGNIPNTVPGSTESLMAADTATDSAMQVPPINSIYPASIDNTITVNSSETVTVVPDIAQVIYAVRTEAKDAASCQTKNTENVNSVIETLQALGISENSIQTSDYYMYPIYNYSNNTQKITGYEATTTLTVSDLPLDNLGNILAQSVQSGINNIQSVTYQSSKYDSGYQEALKLAVATARAKAEVLAEASGCTLGSVSNIVENSNYSNIRYTDNSLSVKQYAADQASTEATIMPGEVDIKVNITVEYFIN